MNKKIIVVILTFMLALLIGAVSCNKPGDFSSSSDSVLSSTTIKPPSSSSSSSSSSSNEQFEITSSLQSLYEKNIDKVVDFACQMNGYDLNDEILTYMREKSPCVSPSNSFSQEELDMINASEPLMDNMQNINTIVFINCVPIAIEVSSGAQSLANSLNEYSLNEQNYYTFGQFVLCDNVLCNMIVDNYKEQGQFILSLDQTQLLYCNSLSSQIVLPTTVTNICYDAFAGCENLSDIQLTNNITNIASKAFSACVNLTKIIVPSSVETVGRCVFYAYSTVVYCQSAERPIGWDEYWDYYVESDYCNVVWDCENNDKDNLGFAYYFDDLVVYSLKNDVATVYNCISTKKESCQLLDSLTYTFNNISKDYKVVSIDDYAFCRSLAITSIEIGQNMLHIPDFEFSSCAKLQNINVDSRNLNYESVSGVLYSKGKSALLCYPMGKTQTNVVVDDCVQIIGDCAFAYCLNIQKIQLPSSLKQINNGAFYSCSNLQNIVISQNVTDIGELVFFDCEHLKIYCEAQEQPQSWNADWLKYSFAEVYWYSATQPTIDGQYWYYNNGQVTVW